jgi:hypothetical protein
MFKTLILAAAIAIATAAHAKPAPQKCNLDMTVMAEAQRMAKHLDVPLRTLLADDYWTFQQGKEQHRPTETMFDWSGCNPKDFDVDKTLTSEERNTLQRAAAQVRAEKQASTLPIFDVESDCGRYSRWGLNSCRNEEQRSYDFLKMIWPQVSPQNRSACLQRVTNPQRPDITERYTHLKECIGEYEAATARQRNFEYSEPFRP